MATDKEKRFLRYFLWRVGLAVLGLTIAFFGIDPLLDERADFSEKAPSYAFTQFLVGLAIMFFGPFVILPIISLAGHYRRDLGGRVTWGVIGLAIGINTAVALVAAFVFNWLAAVYVIFISWSLTFWVIVPLILKARWGQSERS